MRTSKDKRKSFLKCAFFSTAIAVFSFFAFTLIISFAASFFQNPLALCGISSIAVIILSGAFCGYLSAKHKGDGTVGSSLLGAFFFSLLFISISLVLTKGKVSSVAALNSILFFCVSFAFSLIGKRKKRRRR